MKECQVIPAKGKGTWGKVKMKPGTSFQEFSPSGITQDVLNSPSNELWHHVWSVVYQENSLETQCPGVIRGWSHRHCLSSTYQNSRVLEEKKVFSIHHIVFTSSFNIVFHFYEFLECWESFWNLLFEIPAKEQLASRSFKG